MRRIEKRGEVNVLCDDYGCSPATKAEAEFFDEITRLRAEVEVLRADAQRAKVTRLTEGEIAALVDRLGKHSVNGRSHKAIREVEAAVLAKIDAARAAREGRG